LKWENQAADYDRQDTDGPDRAERLAEAQELGEDVDVTVNIAKGTSYTVTITATLAMDAPWGALINNTAYNASGDLSSQASARFFVAGLHKIYLPLTSRQ
jgi:hypothetical protein